MSKWIPIIGFLVGLIGGAVYKHAHAEEVSAEEMLACRQYDTSCWDNIHQRMHIMTPNDLQKPRTIHVKPIKDWNRMYDFIMQKYYHRFSM